MATSETANAAAAGTANGALQDEKQSGAAAGPLKLPIRFPTPSSIPPPRPTLTEAQEAKYRWLLNEAKTWTEIVCPPAAHNHNHHHNKETDHHDSGDKSGPLTDDERLWLTRECLLRYLRATKWHEKEAAKRLLDTLRWRRTYGVETALTADYISPENETGKQIILGYDKQGRVSQYLNPGRQNTDVSPRQVQHLVYMVERVIDLLPPGQETLALLINFKQSKNRSNTAPGIGTAREVLHILQTHYPERLGRALIINVPWVVWGFFKLITPFIDPHTREKLKFNEDMNQYVPSEQLWTEFRGQLDFEYDHDVYWPALTRLAAEQRAARKARWIAGGKQIGELEDYLAGALEHGVAQTVDQPVEQPVAEQPTAAAASDAAATTTATESAADGAKVEDLKIDELKVKDEGNAAASALADGTEQPATTA
ncbi:cral trio domain containing protein [Niveomyces insectorum RCEF 264]|uniref:Cral trio domain containing protein n=1 Tax=Niveomyces insectorum RCEF 264 TaxID=1081102 RepID=A0A167RW90_9HYPO|nr:cral trio domain containing protein [Niveomyces insectorum RCEF 264]